jgi:hypothetical protein
MEKSNKVDDRQSNLLYSPLDVFNVKSFFVPGKSPARIASKRPATSPEHGLVSPASTSPPTKVPSHNSRHHSIHNLYFLCNVFVFCRFICAYVHLMLSPWITVVSLFIIEEE